MRELEKGLLLAELFDPNCISGRNISNFVDWIRNQECYIKLVENMDEVKKSSSILARCLYQEFSTIDLNLITSIEEGMIAYYKILYLCQLSTPTFYVNPLLIINKSERKIKVGEILVKFNNKYITLDEFSKDTRFAFNEKYEFIREKIKQWEDDVYERIVRTIDKLKEHPRNLPNRRVFSFKHVIYGLFLLIISGLVVSGYFVNNEIIKSLYSKFNLSTYTFKNYCMLGLILFVLIGILDYIIETIIRIVKYKKYHRIRKLIFGDRTKLLNIIKKQGENLENYFVKNIEKNSTMKEVAFNFSYCYKLYESFLYLYFINYHCKKIDKDRFSLICKITCSFIAIFFGLIIVYLIVRMGGGAK